MAPIAEFVRPNGETATFIKFDGDVKIVSPIIYVNTESGHTALSQFTHASEDADTLRITSDDAGIVVDGLYPTESVKLPPHTDIVIVHSQSCPQVV
jgi:hypothetical protein